MSLLDKIESFVSKECIEINSAVHQLLQRFVAHAQEPEETPIPDLEPTFTPDPIPEPPADAAPTEQSLPQ
jgi:hypothetical protein